ncbi:MAG: hypothetical protein JRI23_27925 [Deltaproteobacteria bacterium]|jgi:hypothetical protein|nr:hypothetical protein [Deltaproteobacteria bacterium]MBW2535920.1 hypothetical protein [Deltaproteobacteria bacterium]
MLWNVRLWRLVGLALAIVLGATAGLVVEAEAQPVTAKKRWTARKLGGEGMDLFAAGDYGAALEKFAAADELVPAPTLKLRIARCLDKLDRMLEAAATYRSVIETELDRRAPAVHRKARKDAVPELAALREQIPTVRVIVKGPGAETAAVTIDGESLPADALGKKHELDPGTYVIEAERLDDGAVEKRQIVLSREQHEEVILRLPSDKTPGPTRTPEVALADDDGAAWRLAGWIAVGVGGAALSVGSAVGVVVLVEEQDLLERCADRQCPPDAHDDAEQFDTLRIVSTVGLVAGGVGVAAGVTMLLLAPGGEGEGSSGDEEPAEEGDDPGVDSIALSPCAWMPGLCLRGTF